MPSVMQLMELMAAHGKCAVTSSMLYMDSLMEASTTCAHHAVMQTMEPQIMELHRAEHLTPRVSRQ